MYRYKIVVEYDGRDFVGWQRQAAGRSVQGVLEEALSRLCAHELSIQGSGRTDAGVHARGQTASFSTHSGRTPQQILRGGNCLLPPDLAIISAELMPPDFHARFSAVGKIYDYDFDISPTRRPLRQGRAWAVGPELDWDEIARALPYLVGEKDFAAFRSQGSPVSSTVRRIWRAELSAPEDDLKRLSFEGNGFLRHMVRAMAGTLVEIGRGKMPASALEEIIRRGERGHSGPTAPPDGLYLAKVLY